MPFRQQTDHFFNFGGNDEAANAGKYTTAEVNMGRFICSVDVELVGGRIVPAVPMGCADVCEDGRALR